MPLKLILPTANPRMKGEEQSSNTPVTAKLNLESILQSMGDAFVNLNREWRYTFVNNKAMGLMGKKQEELLGKTIWDVFPDIIGTVFETEYRKVMNEGVSTSFETYYASYDMWLEIRAYPHTHGIAIFYTDITQYKKSEAEIQSFNKILEQKIKERTLELELANRELEAFSYSVSHDLRAPLRAMSGYMHILLNEYVEKLDPEAIRLANIVINSTKMMGQLINDLLEFSHLGKRELGKTNINMNELVESIWALLKDGENERTINFTLNPLHTTYADYGTIRQVWSNLISNALKYSRYNPSTEIIVSSEERENEIVYRIQDNGTGFHMDYYHKLFGVFQRLHSQAEFEGTGIGLAIVNKIIEKHNGKVWAEGKPGKGATFYFSLPKTKL